MSDDPTPNVPPRPWPEMVAPTGAQLMLWLRSFTDEHDLDAGIRWLDGLLEAAERGSRCFMANYDHYPVEIEHQRNRIVELLGEVERLEHYAHSERPVANSTEGRYRLAWLSARRRTQRLAALAATAYARGWIDHQAELQRQVDAFLAERGGA